MTPDLGRKHTGRLAERQAKKVQMSRKKVGTEEQYTEKARQAE
jgi:hypothetical protein